MLEIIIEIIYSRWLTLDKIQKDFINDLVNMEPNCVLISGPSGRRNTVQVFTTIS